MTTAVAFLGIFALSANAHMIMNNPYPYNFHTSTPLVQVNPLGPSSPFPCQGLSSVEQVTTLTAGQTQLVEFTGGAQHGGGSCQFSLSYDGPGADKSKWKTIYTLIGGCPVSAAGNLPAAAPDQDGRADSPHCGNDSGTECIRQFNIPLPKGLKNGNATFAWSWFNKMGNREMYNVCAPVTITGGSNDTAFVDSLPSMFVANVPGECTTGQGVLNIPNPGKFGKVLEEPAAGSEGSCEKAAGTPTFEVSDGSSSGGGNPTAPPPPAQPSSPPVAVVPPPPPAVQPPPPSGFTTLTSRPVATPPAAAPAAPTQVGGAGSRAGTGAGSGLGSGKGDKQACSPDGSVVCINSSSFGLCDHGYAVPQALGPGTTCSNGKITRHRRRVVLF
ncbi:hypothetical protein B0H66DRAFT_480169 [Apodospora peruviana]|uniref:Lytic polysaccharide monooxygenase n=1 Tax=Apodospora peruviana TaxID=516989 RepID=A0AAE0M1L1_9PEZI|nr:hypothetical protein B0H66DRAFT_480169 [Apodospora peruviana]